MVHSILNSTHNLSIFFIWSYRGRYYNNNGDIYLLWASSITSPKQLFVAGDPEATIDILHVANYMWLTISR